MADVIGHVVEKYDLKETTKNGIKSILTDIVLQDLQGNMLDCTLWGNYAKDFNKYLMDHDPNGLVIVVLQLCKMKIFSGKIGISNAFDATRVFINESFNEFTQYKEQLETGDNSLTQVVNYVSGQTSMCIGDEFLQTKRATISDVIDTDKVGVCVVMAKIMDFDTAKGWYYEACITCSTRVTKPVGILYYCGKCEKVVPSVRRYKIHAEVMDLTGTTYFTLFERQATQYLGDSISKFLKSTDKGSDLVSWPQDFDKLLDKDMLFKIDINWQTYTLKRTTSDVILIKEFKKQQEIKDDEETDMQNVASPEVADNIKASGNDDETVQIIEKSAEDNNLTVDGNEITPCIQKKRKVIVEDVDCSSPIDGCGTQTTTTKLPKYVEVKKEPSR